MSGMTRKGRIGAEMSGTAERVLVVTINTPPVNALGLAHFRELRDLFLNVTDRFPKARCVVLTGAGRAFCAGADVRELSARTTETQVARSVVSRGCFDAIRRCPVPVVGAVNGAAVGAGVVIASCCDLLLASETATFSLPEILIGSMGGTRHTRRLVPDKIMRYMAFTGRKFDAHFLQQHGGINEVLSAEDLLPAALELAAEIATRSPSGVSLMKESINLTEDMPVTEGYRVEQLFTTLASGIPDSAEAGRAYLEKRQPVWSDD
jgi:enoyl-CoA hydratase